jgi:hypothetical protein
MSLTFNSPTTLLSPEEFLQKNVAPQKSLVEIRKEFWIELGVMKCYGDKIYSHDFDKLQMLFNKINFLMNACLKGDKMRINQFLADYGTVNCDDTFEINIDKIFQG